METWLIILLFVVGLALVIVSAEYLVQGVVGTSFNFGLSPFIISVIFIGFDPENLGVGSLAAFNESSGLALGTVFGAAMVAIALAFGITALISPLEFESAPVKLLVVPIIAVVVLMLLSIDGMLSRWDGLILLMLYGAAVSYMIWITKKENIDLNPTGRWKRCWKKKKSPQKRNHSFCWWLP